MQSADQPTLWLSEKEFEFWVTYLEAAVSTLDQVESALRRDSGMAFADYEILVRLTAAHKHRLARKDLHDGNLFAPDHFANLLKRMQSKRLITIEACGPECNLDDNAEIDQDEHDETRCQALVRLTDSGYERLELAAPDHTRAIREKLLDHLDENDLELARDLLQKLVPSARFREMQKPAET